MKIALCLFGVVGGKANKSGNSSCGSTDVLNIAYNGYKDQFLSKYDVDVFIHCWDVNLKKEIFELYKPKLSIFEKQKQFLTPPYVRVNNKFINDAYRRTQNHYSRWYSTKKVIELKHKYELENNFSYDFVLLTRFDLYFQNPIIFEKLNPNIFYSAPWCYNINILGKEIPNSTYYNWKKNYMPFPISFHKHHHMPNIHGIADLWFLSNSSNIDMFSSLFDNLDDYLKFIEVSNHKLAMHHLLKTGLHKKHLYIGHRFKDFYLVRRKFFNSQI